MRNKMVKKYFAGMLTLAVLIAGIVVIPKDVTAAEIFSFKDGAVVYQRVDKSEFDSKCGVSAPTCGVSGESSGYLFGGWYEYVTDSTNGNVITEKEQVKDASYVYAKFVPARLCGVFCQVKADAEYQEATNFRVVSAVDSPDYQAVGFNVYGRQTDENGVDDWTMYEYKNDGSNPAQSTKVYNKLQTYKYENGSIVKNTQYAPKDLYGDDAENFKFTTMNLSDVPKEFYGATIVVKPYWITMDGTYVEGTGEFNRVNDSPDIKSEPTIVNISVNLKNTTNIAAGMVNVAIPDGFTLHEVECGRVFEEMGVDSSDTKTIKFVGNVADIRKNSEKPNDVIVNLRLTKTGNLTAGTSTFKVTIPTDGFCDKDESFSNVTAWDVVY